MYVAEGLAVEQYIHSPMYNNIEPLATYVAVCGGCVNLQLAYLWHFHLPGFVVWGNPNNCPAFWYHSPIASHPLDTLSIAQHRVCVYVCVSVCVQAPPYMFIPYFQFRACVCLHGMCEVIFLAAKHLHMQLYMDGCN